MNPGNQTEGWLHLVKASPVEVLRAADGHQAVSVGQLREAADLVVLLERGSDGHDDGRVLIGNT